MASFAQPTNHGASHGQRGGGGSSFPSGSNQPSEANSGAAVAALALQQLHKSQLSANIVKRQMQGQPLVHEAPYPGYQFDPSSGLYYEPSSQMYYDPKTQVDFLERSILTEDQETILVIVVSFIISSLFVVLLQPGHAAVLDVECSDKLLCASGGTDVAAGKQRCCGR